jgi:hypothetical protein
MNAVLMRVSALALDKTTKSPYVLLRDEEEKYALPIYIGLMEANAIAMELEKMKFPRPMTHDLLASVIRSLRGRLARIEVTRLEENTFFATLTIERDGEVIEVDARPSDSIALALRMEAPIFVHETVLRDANVSVDGQDEEEKQKWKDFLENLDEDDFGKYKM